MRMQQNSILLILLALIFASGYALQADDEAITISPKWQNFRPSVTYNDSLDEFFVTWIQDKESLSYENPVLVSAFLKAETTLKKLKGKKIPRNNAVKTMSPYAAARYNAFLDLYYIVFQDINRETGEKRLLITTMSTTGKFLKKSVVLTETEGFLLQTPLLLNVDGTREVIVVWNEIGPSGYRSMLMKFDVEAPHSAPKISTMLSQSDKRSWKMIRAIFPGDQGYNLFGYNIYHSRQKNKEIFKQTLDQYLQLSSEAVTVTKNSVKESDILYAAPAKKGEMLLYNKTIPGKERGYAAVLNFPESQVKVKKPFNIASKDISVSRAKMLERAYDNKHRVFWLEEDTSGNSVIKIQPLALKGKPTGKQSILIESSMKITAFDVCYNKEKDAVVLVWCEDLPQNDPEDAFQSRVRAQYINLAQL